MTENMLITTKIVHKKYDLKFKNNYNTLGRPKSSFAFFCTILPTSLNEIFGQANIYLGTR